MTHICRRSPWRHCSVLPVGHGYRDYGAMGIRRMRTELRELEARFDEAADRNWKIREAQERAATFLEAQDDLIGRRDASGAISYVNDAY